MYGKDKSVGEAISNKLIIENSSQRAVFFASGNTYPYGMSDYGNKYLHEFLCIS